MPNWIGDCMMALPTLHYLEKQGFELTLIGKAWLTDLFADNWPVITFSKNDPQCINAVKTAAATEMLLLTNSFSSAKFARKCGKQAIGYKGDYRSLLLAKKYSKFANLHEANHFLKLAQLYCADVLNNEPMKAFNLPTKATNAIKQNQQHLKTAYPFLDKPFIVLCPFAAGTNKAGHSKVWPYWPELIATIQQTYPELNIIVCPNKDEQLPISSDMNSTTLHLLDNINLINYFTLMSLADAVIGNDTGPMHMATAVNKQSVTLFGATDPERTIPIDGYALGSLGEWAELEKVMMFLAQKNPQ